MSALERRIKERLRGRRAAVVGVGNTLRGDDGAGPAVAAALVAAGRAGVVDAGTVPENFLGTLAAAAPQVVLFVDAAELGEAPGTTRLADVDELAARGSTTHALSLRLMAELLAAEGAECWLLGIQPASTALGAPMSAEVAAAVTAAAAALARALPAEAVHA